MKKNCKPHGILSPEECRVLMEDVHRLPARSSSTAGPWRKSPGAMAEAVNQQGAALDVQRIYSAALVHDAARLQENHAEKGAQLLDDLGCPEMAGNRPRAHEYRG